VSRGLLLLTALAAAAAVGAGHGTASGAQFPAFQGAVPVLLYHGLSDSRGGVDTPPALFDAEMQRLHELGFEAITLDRYVGFMRGEPVALPTRPILITFDDGLLSSWENADGVLARYGWSAAMYVPTGFVGRPGRLSWGQLEQMQGSGRWQVDEHAGDGHVLVAVDAAGRRGPFYADELWLDGRRESFADYERRVAGDIELGASLIADHLPGPHETFAVPFGNYGQRGANDPRIAPWLAGYLRARFAVSFVQRDDSFTTPGQRFANRITMASGSTPDLLEARLRTGLGQLAVRRAAAAPSQGHRAVSRSVAG
jgi:hypothetical protein